MKLNLQALLLTSALLNLPSDSIPRPPKAELPEPVEPGYENNPDEPIPDCSVCDEPMTLLPQGDMFVCMNIVCGIPAFKPGHF